MTSPQDKVAEFHHKFNAPSRRDIGLPGRPSAERSKRMELLAEEVDEYREAEGDDDIVGVAGELADIVYVAYGTAIAYGIDLDGVIDEVHRANLTKSRDPDDEHGKLRKGDDFEPPDVLGELLAQADWTVDQAHQRRDDAAADYLRAPMPEQCVAAGDRYEDAQRELEEAEGALAFLEGERHG